MHSPPACDCTLLSCVAGIGWTALLRTGRLGPSPIACWSVLDLEQASASFNSGLLWEHSYTGPRKQCNALLKDVSIPAVAFRSEHATKGFLERDFLQFILGSMRFPSVSKCTANQSNPWGKHCQVSNMKHQETNVLSSKPNFVNRFRILSIDSENLAPFYPMKIAVGRRPAGDTALRWFPLWKFRP